MPKLKYQEYTNSDLYTSMYEQYYFKNSPLVKVKPIKKVKKKKKINLFPLLVFSSILFCVFSYSFKNYVADIFPLNSKTVLNVDYRQILYPTHSYLYKDLFLGKYIVEEATYSKPLMVNVNESYQMTSLRNKLVKLSNDYRKIHPSVYVYEYGSKAYVDINANEVFPAASIIKLPVLIEMFREIDSGKFSLYDEMVLQDYYRASGSGKLQYSRSGRAHTMDYLAKIMIENSDNSSTNMIMSKMGGMPQVNKAMERWGLKATHINNWLPDLEGTNVTTARELGKMLYNIDSTNIISSSAKRHISDYMSHVKNNRLLQAGLPSNAILLHKTGDIGFMLGDAGIVKTPKGKKYIVVILAKRPYNNLQGKNFIVKASKIIYNHLAN